jgi:hypothetical protein
MKKKKFQNIIFAAMTTKEKRLESLFLFDGFFSL